MLPRLTKRRGILVAAAALVLVPRRIRAESSAQSSDADFLQLSELLTGRRDLNPELSHRLGAALAAVNSDFARQVSAIAALARTRAMDAVEPLATTLDVQDPKLAGTLHAIIAAWYTGVAGDGPKAKVIAYRDALMFQVVEGVVAAPSYCRAAPDYWTAKPPTV